MAAFILENTEDIFKNSIYSKIYHDDGFKIDMGIQTIDKICDWPEVFQMRVNNLTGLDSLKFTMGIWNSGSPLKEKPWKKELKITIEEDFHIWIWKCIGEKRWTEIMSTSKTQSSPQIPQ